MWHHTASAREQWQDAPDSDEELAELLEVARIACEAYAPALVTDAEVPANYRFAQLMHARNLWNSYSTDPQSQFGADGFQITTYPMDWVVKGILRPQRGKVEFF